MTACPGLPRLRIMIALAAAALSMSDQPRFLRQATRWLDLELVRQVLPDGGHVSRNPGAVLEVLVDLLPLRQAFAARGGQPSRILLSAIDRMMPMLRFFRQGDGGFAHFNGMGDTPADLLATVLAYDDVRGAPLTNAPHSGYQRFEAGGTVLIVDAGRPPPTDFSMNAHAGCLSFELSVGRQRLIINCGVPFPSAGSLRRLARTTAAHSTVTHQRHLVLPLPHPFLGRRMARRGDRRRPDAGRCRAPRRGRAPPSLPCATTAMPTASASCISASSACPIRATGSRASIPSSRRRASRSAGAARTASPSASTSSPGVKALRAQSGRAVLLELPDGETWEFATDGLEARDRGEHPPLQYAQQPQDRADRHSRPRPEHAHR